MHGSFENVINYYANVLLESSSLVEMPLSDSDKRQIGAEPTEM